MFKSRKQKQLEKEQKTLEEKRKKSITIQWSVSVLLILFGLLAAPSVSMVFFFLAGAATMPIELIKKLWSKIPIKGNWFKPTIIAIVACIALGGLPSATANKDANSSVIEETTEQKVSSESTEKETEPIVSNTSVAIEPETETEPKQEPEQKVVTPTEKEDTQIEKTDTQVAKTDELTVSSVEISLSDIPVYSGNAYVEINGNVPYFNDSELITTAFENYSNLDSLGRCGIAYANICKDIMPTEERGAIGSVKPTGWQTIKYDCVDGKYLYNRCHLIGFQLAGENANTKNLIAGTRYMNVEGMLPFENMVADYVKETNNHVLYRVTPVFEGNNLVVNGVLIEAKSVEDKGDGILFNVYCYNNQPGVSINYADGSSQLVGSTKATNTENKDTSTKKVEEAQKPSSDNADTNSVTVPSASETGGNLVWVPTNGGTKYHTKSSCSGMKDPIQVTEETAIANGYEPCKRCH